MDHGTGTRRNNSSTQTRPNPEEPERDLEPADKARLTALLHEDVTLSSHCAEDARCTLLAAVDAMISGLSSIVLQNAPHDRLVLPRLDIAVYQPDHDDES